MKGTSRAAKKSATKKKAIQGKRKKEDDLESDGDDGVPGGKLRKIQKQLFDTCLEGKAKFDTFSKSQTAPKSFKAMKSQAGDTIDAFHQNEHGNEKMAQFKKEEMNPIARKAKESCYQRVCPGPGSRIGERSLGRVSPGRLFFVWR